MCYREMAERVFLLELCDFRITILNFNTFFEAYSLENVQGYVKELHNSISAACNY